MRVRTQSQSVTATLLPLILLLGVPACGNDGRPPCFPVHGEVFVGEGKQRIPASGARIEFHPEVDKPTNDPKPTAIVDGEGKYTISTYVTGDGAPAGTYKIAVTWLPPEQPGFVAMKNQGAADKLKGRYDPKASKIRYTVEKSKSNLVPTIELR